MSNSQKPGCGGLLASLFGGRSQNDAAPVESYDDTSEPLPYRLTKEFLSPAEISFYHVLRQVVEGNFTICTKVSLGDLFYPSTKDRSKFQTYRNKIDRKHVDFLLCDPATMQPVLGIELDDGSHRQAARQERDIFVEEVFAAAGLSLFRQPVQHSYHVGQLTAGLQQYVAVGPAPKNNGTPSAKPPEPIDLNEPQITAPTCPKCGQPMVLRTVKKAGPNQGQQFWGCQDYPKCRGMRPLEE